MSRIEELISEIENYIDKCKMQPFSNNKKLIVEKDIIDDLLVELRLRIPDEIKKYQKIISNRDSILSDAHAKADAMLNAANQQTSELTNEHEIMRRAQEQADAIIEQANITAQNIINNATLESNEIKIGAVRYTDQMLKGMLSIISHSMENTQNKFSAFMTSMQSSYDIVMANRRELQPETDLSGQTDAAEQAQEDL